MADEGKLVAVQLANKKLAETNQKMESELVSLRAANARLEEENDRLKKSLDQLNRSHETIKSEYHQATGGEYTGRMQTSMFGFSKAKK